MGKEMLDRLVGDCSEDCTLPSSQEVDEGKLDRFGLKEFWDQLSALLLVC